MQELWCVVCGDIITGKGKGSIARICDKCLVKLKKLFSFCMLCMFFTKSNNLGGSGKCSKKFSHNNIVSMLDHCCKWKRGTQPLIQSILDRLHTSALLEEEKDGELQDRDAKGRDNP